MSRDKYLEIEYPLLYKRVENHLHLFSLKIPVSLRIIRNCFLQINI